VPELPSLFAPEAQAVVKTVDIESWADIQNLVAKNLGTADDATQVFRPVRVRV
jgi:hypothetical protein